MTWFSKNVINLKHKEIFLLTGNIIEITLYVQKPYLEISIRDTIFKHWNIAQQTTDQRIDHTPQWWIDIIQVLIFERGSFQSCL